MMCSYIYYCIFLMNVCLTRDMVNINAVIYRKVEMNGTFQRII